MNKFLNFLFGLGKIISILMLIGFLSSVVIYGIKIKDTFEPIQLETPSYFEIKSNMDALKNKKSKADAPLEPYVIVFNELADQYLTDYGRRTILDQVNQIDWEYREVYVKGLYQAISDFYANTSKNISDKEFSNRLEDTVYGYDRFFRKNLIKKQMQETKQLQERYTSFGVCATCILLFIITLIIPLLIKIEENTRK